MATNIDIFLYNLNTNTPEDVEISTEKIQKI